MKQTLEFVLDIIFPKICQSCGVEGHYLCTSCLAEVELPFMYCPECDKPSPLGMVHPVCEKKTTRLHALMVAAKYEDPAIRNLVWELKYNSARSIASDLSLLLVDFLVKNDLLDYFTEANVTAVPLHKTRLKLRGFNQAEALAQNLAEKLNLPYHLYLEKATKTKRQVDLSLKERLDNVRGVFQLMPKYKTVPKKILLVDDIATTGATLKECAKVLKKAGAKEVWGLVIARNK